MIDGVAQGVSKALRAMFLSEIFESEVVLLQQAAR